MNIECSIEKLKTAILQTEKITGKNLTLPILNSILFIAEGNSLKLRATNLSLGIEIEVPAKITEKGTVAIKGEVLVGIFSTLTNEGVVTLTQKGDVVTIKTKQHTLTVKTYPHDDFPTIPMVEGDHVTIPSKKLLEGLKSVYYSAAVSDIKPEIASVYIYTEGRSMIFVATDSFRLAEKKITIKEALDIPSIILPFKNVSEIIKVFSTNTDDITIHFSDNQISLSNSYVYLSSRIINGSFPDYKQIIPKEFQTEVIVLKEDLLQALKMANIFSDKFNQISIVLDPEKKIFNLASKNTEIGENVTSVQAAIKGNPIEIAFNYKYFLDLFQSITSDSIVLKFKETSKPMVVEQVNDSSFLYLIMPLNR